MHSLKICKQYLDAVNKRNLSEILALFVPNGVVTSPLSGTMSVRGFHENLFARQPETVTRIRNIFATVNSVSGVALHFTHSWTQDDGKTIEFDGMDIFELTPDGTRFEKLTILFDPTALRADYANRQPEEV